MMSSDDVVRVFEHRATAFLLAAKDSFSKGRYDVACVEAEQAAQLALKAALYRVSGMIPRTHSLRKLLGVLGEALNATKMVGQFVNEHRTEVIALEGAYLGARYGAEHFSKEDAELCVAVAETILTWLKRQVKSGFAHGEE